MSAFARDVLRGEKAFEPGYRRLARAGVLAERARDARLRLRNCDLCARYCHVDRTENIRGAICRSGERAVVYSAGPHHGEEDCLRGVRGSGTIFFPSAICAASIGDLEKLPACPNRDVDSENTYESKGEQTRIIRRRFRGNRRMVAIFRGPYMKYTPFTS